LGGLGIATLSGGLVASEIARGAAYNTAMEAGYAAVKGAAFGTMTDS
jgi:hypothetical protein